MSEPTAADDTPVTFHVKTSGGGKWTLTLPLSTTVADLKSKLAGEDMASVPVGSQRLIYSGKVLKDHETLATHKIKPDTTMHLVKSAPSNQRQNPASDSSQPIPNAGQPQSNAGVPANLASGTGHDPLAGLTGARYAGFAGLPSLESLANPPSPDDMLRRLQDPNFAQQLNEALQNPQMIDMMINMNPQLRAMGPAARQVLQSENFRRMMTNPEALRSMMNMQNAMGMDPFGGIGGGQAAFPAPGVTNAAEQTPQGQAAGQNNQGGASQPQQQNPFSLFNQMYGAGVPQGDGNTANQATNPFMALLNPAMFGQPQTQSSHTGTANTTGTADATSSPPNSASDRQANASQPQQPPPNPFMNFQNNPFLQHLMQNPEAANNAMAALFGGAGAGTGAGQATGQEGFNNPFNMLGMGGFGGGGPPDNRPPEERFSTQLRQLNEMGFYDFDRNVQALNRSGGDVNGALEWLFSQGT